MKFIFILFILFSFFLSAKEKGQTEITTDEGIEVFQKEKYYLLKKNVIINSDDFVLTADLVKAFFEKDLYDIQSIESKGNVKFKSSNGSMIFGERLNFYSKNNKIEVYGKKSLLTMNDLKMKSDQYLEIDDLLGTFILKGPFSELQTEDILIIGSLISGNYIKINDQNDIVALTVIDDKLTKITTDTLVMYASKAIYSKKDNIIELFDNVKVIRNKEVIVGDYAKVNTLNESYKVKSKNENKVKILIDNTNE